jgi:UDP-glucose 4-epimerase
MSGRPRSAPAGRSMVTGGAGFIGSSLVDRLLAEGHEVDVVDDLSSGSIANLADARSSGGVLKFHHLDICSDSFPTLVGLRRPAVIYHLAAQPSPERSIADPIHDAGVNMLGSLHVLEAARAAGVSKIVYAASGGTLYGELEEADLPVAEGAPYRPVSPYGASKKAVIDYLVAYRELHGLEFTALALANVYGPRQDADGEAGVVAAFAAALTSGRACTISGDGLHTRDYVYVDDVVDAFARAGRRGGGLVINVATGHETSNLDLYWLMASVAGSTAPPRHGPERHGEVLRSALDPHRAAIHLGWKPWTPLPDGVTRVVEEARRRTPR